jgi:hypothetical protein
VPIKGADKGQYGYYGGDYGYVGEKHQLEESADDLLEGLVRGRTP